MQLVNFIQVNNLGLSVLFSFSFPFLFLFFFLHISLFGFSLFPMAFSDIQNRCCLKNIKGLLFFFLFLFILFSISPIYFHQGRASVAPILDLFMTFLSMGEVGWKKLLQQRKACFFFVPVFQSHFLLSFLFSSFLVFGKLTYLSFFTLFFFISSFFRFLFLFCSSFSPFLHLFYLLPNFVH